MSKRFKSPSASTSGKIRTPQDTPNYDLVEPKFSFSYMQKGYSISDATAEAKSALADTLVNLSSQTWLNLKLGTRHGQGYEKIPELQENLPNRFKGGMPIAFRFWSMHPMVGVRIDDVFYLIWLDLKMDLYKH